MRALVVVAHPERTSFTWAMADAAVSVLRAEGLDVKVSDLYGEDFNPTAGRHDFTTVAEPERFHYQTEQQYASRHDGYSAELRREQGRVANADVLLFVFPIWWGGMPAILKGWFDRVLAYGFAYEDGMRYETGFFANRSGLIGATTGGTAHRFSEGGSYGSIEQVLWPTQHCMIEYLGMSTLPPFVAYASPRVSPDERLRYLEQWGDRVRELVVMQSSKGPTPPRASSLTADWASAPDRDGVRS